METVLSEREKEIDVSKQRLEHEMHEHRKSKEKLMSAAKSMELDRKHIEHSNASGKHAALLYYKLKQQISQLERDLENSLDMNSSYRKRLALAEKKLNAFSFAGQPADTSRAANRQIFATETQLGQLRRADEATELKEDGDEGSSDLEPQDTTDCDSAGQATQLDKHYANWMDDQTDSSGSKKDFDSESDYGDQRSVSEHSSSFVDVHL